MLNDLTPNKELPDAPPDPPIRLQGTELQPARSLGVSVMFRKIRNAYRLHRIRVLIG